MDCVRKLSTLVARANKDTPRAECGEEPRSPCVRSALVNRRIDPTRVIARGFGESYPVASNGSGIGRPMNRRVEIVISDPNGAIGSRGGTPLASARVR